ncbi:Deoxyribonuclease-2-alpha [Trichinella murrelli]|uniref:Deoxyribonuclease-2-alpha n=1 Tax=Trichinella murrelli TaxID=144512 RepID=A0A0V0TVD4_9BILA|nr:Deoxyribonuclease-2-alpha [Trichinella murrelli]
MLLKLSNVVLIFLLINLSHSQTSTCRNNNGGNDADWKVFSHNQAIVYKAPAQDTGKIIHAGAVGNWDNGQAPFTNSQGHSFAKTLEHVVGDDRTIKFLAYNNVPPGIPNVKTKSNSKGVIILSTAADSAAWVIHTIPGFPTAKTPYAWPASETARGHLLICLTISKSQINAIAASLLLVQPVIHYNDIPETETAGMPYFNKLAEGQTLIIPPFTSRRSIRTQNPAAPVTVHIYSKSESSKYGKKNQSKEPAMAICIENNDIFTRFNEIAAHTTSDFLLRKSMKTLFTLFSLAFLAIIVQGGEESGKKVEPLPCKDRGSKASCNRYMKKDNFEELCKENRRIGRYLCCKTCAEKLGVEVNEDGKFKDFGTFTYYEPTCPALEDRGNHTICEMIKHGSEVYKCDQSEAQAACAKTCNLNTENVVQTHESIKFLAYNNVPPGIPNIKTKSNSKGVIIISTAANSAAAWVVHTIPGFPTAKTPYNWPASETARGHLLICLTTETAGMPYFKKLAEGQTPIIPPFTSIRSIRTQSPRAPVTVHIYSKSETSKYGDCRVLERYIRLLQSPGVINGHITNLEADDTNCAVSDPRSVICHVDKPYIKNQSKEPAMAICIENNDIFTRFNEIAAQKKSFMHIIFIPLTLLRNNK